MAMIPGHPVATRNPCLRVSPAHARAAYMHAYIHTYTHIHVRHGEVRCTPLDFPGFSQGCGRALNRVEGGRRVRVEGRAAASERMVVAEAGEEEEEKDEEVEAARGKRGEEGWMDEGEEGMRGEGGRNYNEWCAQGRAG